MDYGLFLQRCEQKFPNEDGIKLFIDKVESVFASEDFSNDRRAFELFYTGDKISKPKFFKIKKLVKEFYYWLFENGYVKDSQVKNIESITMDDIVSDDEIRRYYFSSLGRALDFVAAVGEHYMMGADNDLLMVKSIVILSWYGLSLDQMLSLKKEDLIISRRSVMVDDIEIKLDAEYFNVLYRFSFLDEHKMFPVGKLITYLSSDYLMRSSRSTQMNKNMIYQILKKFNYAAEKRFEHKISLSSLQINNAFCEMIKGKQDSKSLTTSLEINTGCDRHAAFAYKIKYEKWKDIYYPNGGDVG